MTIDPHAYNINIRRDTFEGEALFEVRVKELPDLVEYAETHDEAYDLAVDTIATAAEAYAAQGRVFPEAMVPVDDYSGRVTLRLPRSLHRALAETAKDEGMSLNQHLVSVLSYSPGYASIQNQRNPDIWSSSKKEDLRQHEGMPHLTLVRNDRYQDEGHQLSNYEATG